MPIGALSDQGPFSQTTSVVVIETNKVRKKPIG